MWTVATSTSIETGTRPHYGFAQMLYNELMDIQPQVTLNAKSNRKTQKQQSQESSV